MKKIFKLSILVIMCVGMTSCAHNNIAMQDTSSVNNTGNEGTNRITTAETTDLNTQDESTNELNKEDRGIKESEISREFSAIEYYETLATESAELKRDVYERETYEERHNKQWISEPVIDDEKAFSRAEFGCLLSLFSKSELPGVSVKFLRDDAVFLKMMAEGGIQTEGENLKPEYGFVESVLEPDGYYSIETDNGQRAIIIGVSNFETYSIIIEQDTIWIKRSYSDSLIPESLEDFFKEDASDTFTIRNRVPGKEETEQKEKIDTQNSKDIVIDECIKEASEMRYVTLDMETVYRRIEECTDQIALYTGMPIGVADRVFDLICINSLRDIISVEGYDETERILYYTDREGYRMKAYLNRYFYPYKIAHDSKKGSTIYEEKDNNYNVFIQIEH